MANSKPVIIVQGEGGDRIERSKIAAGGAPLREEEPSPWTARKFVLTDVSKEVDGETLYQIQCVRSFAAIEEGALGGWVAREESLSHSGACWVTPDSQVRDTSYVSGDSQVSGGAVVKGNSRVDGRSLITGEGVIVEDNSFIQDSLVSGKARITDSCVTHGVKVSGSAKVISSSLCCTGVEVGGTARVQSASISAPCFILDGVVQYKSDYVTIGLSGETTLNFRTGTVARKGGTSFTMGAFAAEAERQIISNGNYSYATSLRMLNVARFAWRDALLRRLGTSAKELAAARGLRVSGVYSVSSESVIGVNTTKTQPDVVKMVYEVIVVSAARTTLKTKAWTFRTFCKDLRTWAEDYRAKLSFKRGEDGSTVYGAVSITIDV